MGGYCMGSYCLQMIIGCKTRRTGRDSHSPHILSKTIKIGGH
jgi:hypothetical protein